MVPVVDLVEIGNGGGSIAWVDDFGKLHVGPRSAGARARARRPTGAAAPRRRRPTPTSRSAGSTPTTSAAARSTPTWTAVERALDAVAGRLGVGRVEAARGIVRIAEQQHGQRAQAGLASTAATTRATSRSSRSAAAAACTPSALAARARHAAAWSSRRSADVFSAWGMLMSDLRRDFFLTRLARPDAGDGRPTRGRFGERRGAAREQFADEGIAAGAGAVRAATAKLPLREPGALRRGASCPTARSTPPPVAATIEALPRALRARVHLPARRPGRVRRRRTSWRSPRSASSSPRRLPGDRPRRSQTRARASATSTSPPRASTGGDLRRRAARARDARSPGPAIVETAGTTIVVHPGEPTCSIDDYGNVASSSSEAGDERATRPTRSRSRSSRARCRRSSDEMFAAYAQDRDERDHLRGARHGHRRSPTREGDLASSGAGIPGFVGVLDKAVKRILELQRRRRRSGPGDIFVTNDPFYGGVTHLNDVGAARCRSSPASELIAWTREHRPLERRRRHGARLDLDRGDARSSRRACGSRRSSSSSGGAPIESVLRDHEGQQPPARLPARATCGPGSRRCGSASGGSSSSSSATASTPSWPRVDALHGLRRAGVAGARCATCRKGASRCGGAGQRRRSTRSTVEITDDAFVVDLRDNPDQDDGPNNALARRRADRGADGVQERHRPAGRRRTPARSARCSCSPGPGSVFDAEPARRLRPSTTRSRSGCTT